MHGLEGVSRAADPEPWRLDPRLCRAPRSARRAGERAANARRRAARRGHGASGSLHFRRDVMLSKLRLLSMLRELKEKGARIAGISAPSRASTLVNYVGLDEGIDRLRLRDRGLAEDRQMHARHADSGGGRKPGCFPTSPTARSFSPGISPTSWRPN